MKQIRLIAVISCLLASAASATVFQPTNDRQLVDRSDAVVIATVREAASHVRTDGYVVTDYRFDVEQTLKGAAAGTITVSEIGGVAGERFTFISDSASYTPGERVMVFLRKRGDGTYFTTSMAMGKFSFTRTARGESVVTRDVSELRDDPARLTDEFEQFVKGGKSGTYQTKLTPIATGLHPIATAAPSAFTLVGCGAGCFPVRVQGGEAGAGLSFKSTGSLAGVDGPGGIANAAAIWTNDPNSGIVLSYGGTFTSTAPNTDDNQNGVYLGYSGPDIGICDGTMGCTLGAGNFTHTFKGETFIGISDADIIVRPGIAAGQYLLLITHEIGHAIGFRHSNEPGSSPNDSNAVMASFVNTSVLQSWDLEALATVYGNGPVCQPPTSVSIIGGGTYTSGQTATLTANVTGGNGTFTYVWFDGALNDTSHPVGTNSSSFTTPPITATKNYWVRVTNACGNVTAAASVSPQTEPVCTPVSVIGQPNVSQSVNSGGTATLTVTAGGSSPFSYQWYQATSTLDTSHPVGSNSPSFTTPALTQATSYWVRVTNGCGIANSNIATVSIAGQCTPPSFSIQPASATIAAGSQTYLIAFANGASSYQWYKGNAGDTSTPVAGVGPSNDRFINQLYIDLLGRTADAAALSTFNGLLAGGGTRNDVAAAILVSAEYRQKLLTDFYSTFLHRPISPAEVSFWGPAFAAGMTDEQIEAQILASPEYFALGGSTNSSWINRVFNDVLGRSPSAAETSSFLTLLGSSSRLNIGLAILNSGEAITRRVQQAFPRLLHRTGTPVEQTTFVAALLGGVTDEQFLAQLLASDEYFNFGTLLFTGPISVTTRYWVRATNGICSADSSVATLTVPQCTPPVIVTQPSNVVLTAGETFSVGVIATGATSYQWFRASSGDPSNPISGATGPVFTSSITNVGPTNFWVRVTNECGSTNSNTVTVTTQCGPRVPVLSAPPIAPSATTYPITWNGSSQRDAAYELQEATKADFSDAQTFFINNGATTRTFSHTVTADTRYYYRVHAAPICGGNFGGYSPTANVLVTAPQPSTQSNYNFAQLPCPQSPCIITQRIFIPGITTSGKTALATGDTFSAASDKPFMTISPSTGALPPEGATVTATIDLTQLEVGSTQASIAINRAPSAGKTGAFGDPPPATTNIPVSVSVVAPVTPTPKDPNAGFNALLIPAVAHVDGVSRFVSDVRLTNTASQAIDYQLTFTPNGTDGTLTGKQFTLTVKAGDTKALNDIVKDWYGSGVLGEPPQGSLEIRPLNFAGKDTPNITLATVAASRTYSVTSTGTFGQYIPALAVVNFLSKASASKISLQQVSQSSAASGFRTNLGFIEGSGQPVVFIATLLDDAGHTIAERDYSLKPYESQQQRLDQFFGVSSITDGRVEVRVASDTGHVSAYASVLDNTTTDPLLVFPADPAKISAKRFVVPGVAEFDTSFSNFHTDMRIYNGGSSPVDVTLAFTGASVPNKVRTIGAGETLAIDNVLPTLWN
ncbi:MAG: hypothetical protein QOE68_3141, partial [Thermoanaerobaculia bacterium]|nr:hypothetical protein [Thermoanaerobaculia bacterium]